MLNVHVQVFTSVFNIKSSLGIGEILCACHSFVIIYYFIMRFMLIPLSIYHN